MESTSRIEIESLQLQSLQQLLSEILPRNPFWSAKLSAAGLTAADVRTLADLARFPFTTKAEILADQQAHPPYGTNLTYGRAAYSRLHQTSGTTGVPMRWLDSPESWQRLLQSWEQLYRLMGLRKDDRLLFAFSFGPFLGFWAGFEGAHRLGNLCVAAGGLSSAGRLKLLLENEATIVCCTPTYALRLAEVAAEQNVDLPASPVRAILVAGEPGGNIPATRQRIEQAWGARAIDHWGMTELGPLAIEPEDRPGGLTVIETDCIPEIIDPVTGEPVAVGQEGELVITNLTRFGNPLIRYRTGDRVRASAASTELLHLEGGILGRTDEMLTIRGNNLYPSALEDVIRSYPEIVEFRIQLRTVKAMQHLTIEIEPASTFESVGGTQLASCIAEEIKNRWHFQAEVAVVEPGTLPRFEMKARRFVRVTDR